jgi:hypothetical protein
MTVTCRDSLKTENLIKNNPTQGNTNPIYVISTSKTRPVDQKERVENERR